MGKREAQRNASPLVNARNGREALKERNNRCWYFALSALFKIFLCYQGDAFRCASRLPLAFIFRAFGDQFRFFVQR